MDILFGLVGKGFVILAGDTTAARSIVKMKSDEDKVKTLGPHLAMAYSGEPGDTTHFAEYIERNLRLDQIRNVHERRPEASAAWIRSALANSIRSRSPYAVNILVGGFDISSAAIIEGQEELGGTPKLYWLDLYGTKVEVPFAAHGIGNYFALSLLDRYHDPNASVEEAMGTLKRCINEISKRTVMAPSKYKAKIIDKDGVRDIEIDI